MKWFDIIKKYLVYGGIGKKEYNQVKKQIAEVNQKTLSYWSVLVSFFWIYCIARSFNSADYLTCRPAYIISLCVCVLVYLCSRFIVPKFPKTFPVLKYIFRLSLLCGGIGIAICQPNVRSLTMFAVAIMSPSVFIDSTLSSIIVHASALIIYILFGRGVILPDIYSWGVDNFVLFTVFGLLIGNAINKERFERYVYAESEKELAEVQMRYAYYDRMTGLKNRRAYEETLLRFADDAPSEFCVIMADINGLKDTNDTIGHAAGDELITGASECLTAAFDGTDEIYRIGGDEFSIIMAGTVEKAQQCIVQFNKLISEWHGKYINGISASTGVASNKEYPDIEAITVEADRKMYENKRNYYLAKEKK